MRRDDEAARAPLRAREIGERRHCHRDVRGEIQQQNVASLDRPLYARDQRDAAITRVTRDPRIVELRVVKRDGQCVVAKLGRAINQVDGAVAD